VAAENLTQAERDLLYALRDFTRLRKEFTVEIASRYYSVLQSRDIARNNWRGYQDFKRDAARERAFAAFGRVAKAELGRLEQAELNAEDEWLAALRRYKRDLDDFKIDLGLSTDAPVVLDDAELEQLTILHPKISADDAVRVALLTRLDLYNARDREEDGDRKLHVASRGLLPSLDLIVSATADSKEGDRFQELDFKRWHGSAGFDLDLDLDRKAERNALRRALINYDRAGRDLAQLEDQIKLDVREAWRALDQARRTYEIRELGVELNEGRVEEEQLRADLGRSRRAQDQVDARNDLIRARNQLTQALVNHTIARLQFWRDMGILFVKEDGQWEEVTDVVEQP
jgi:outer membrane protein TolC